MYSKSYRGYVFLLMFVLNPTIYVFGILGGLFDVFLVLKISKLYLQSEYSYMGGGYFIIIFLKYIFYCCFWIFGTLGGVLLF